MRDGVELSANLYHSDPLPAPLLLTRLPYDKDGDSFQAPLMPSIGRLVAAGYSVVVQDCRGTFGSDGHFVPFDADVEDGEDTVRWITAQSWCDGAVGMFGSSYLGIAQWMAAVTGVPGLRAIAPAYAPPDPYDAFVSTGGAMQLSATTEWSAGMYLADARRAEARGEPVSADADALAAALADPRAFDRVLPTGAVPELAEAGGWWTDWMAHPSRDEYWAARSVRDRIGDLRIPALHIGGWFDLYIAQTSATFLQVQRELPADIAAEHRLIIGPWDHLGGNGVYRDRDFGVSASVAAFDVTGAYLQFFDRWLRERDDALAGSARVRLFLMGADRWIDADDWPLPGTRWTEHHLSSGPCGANTASGDGTLSTETADVERADVMVADPRDPVPTAGGATLPMDPGFGGPVEQSAIESREDVLCFTGPVLAEPLCVIGPVRLHAFVSTSAADADVAAKLVDVWPDGRAISLCDGFLRLRFRDGAEAEQPVRAGEVMEVEVDLGPTANVFLPGHRVRLDIAGSNFPHYDRNTHTGRAIAADGPADLLVALTTIHSGPTQPTRLILPVVDRPATASDY